MEPIPPMCFSLVTALRRSGLQIQQSPHILTELQDKQTCAEVTPKLRQRGSQRDVSRSGCRVREGDPTAVPAAVPLTSATQLLHVVRIQTLA